MGQCTSRKASGSLTTTSTFVSHIKSKKMEEPRNFKSNNDDESRKNRFSTNENSQLLGTKKSQPKSSKGVAMSFGFKRRPTPMTSNSGSTTRDLENPEPLTNDPNGNKDDSHCLTKNQSSKVRTMHKVAPSQKPASITPRPPRFGFYQATTDRTNNVANIKTAPSPSVEFGTAMRNSNKSRLTSPITETDVSIDRRQSFSRNAMKTETVERLTSPTTEQDMLNNRRARAFSKHRLTSPTTDTDMSIDRRTSSFGKNTTKTENMERLTSPTTEQDISNGARTRTFSRNMTKRETTEKLASPTTEHLISNDRSTRTLIRNISKTENAERQRAVIDNNENAAVVKDRLGNAQLQIGKFTFQTTRLPQPEAIRVVETKTAKTIANNNKRFARIRRQFEEASMKVEEDSGRGSNISGYLCENDPMTNVNTGITLDDNRLQQNLKSNVLNIMDNSDSFSETSTPPPLPELPSVFHSYSPKRTNVEKEFVDKEKHESKRPFIKLGTQRTFLKSRQTESDSSPPSQSENDWINAGEAMAEDSGLLVNPKHDSYESTETSTNIIQEYSVSTCVTVVEAALQTLVKPSVSLDLRQNVKVTQKMSLVDEDPCFTAVAATSKTGHLLDEEILSPVESLLSCSETEEILKKKIIHSSSNSKDINEKLTAASPDTPSNGTYSLSLSDDKEDFLIDDEIADQPELVFEDTMNNLDINTSFNYLPEKMSEIKQDSVSDQRTKSFEIEGSPFASRKKRDFLRSITGSIESLSPCESIDSDDLMMEYDISQTNEHESCDRRSGSFSSLEDTSKFRLKSDDMTFGNKNIFRSSSSKPMAISRTETPSYVKDSPRLLIRKFSHQSSPEHTKSPKNNPLHQFGFNSMAYDPTSDCLMLTKTNHSAIQQDIIGVKTMLLTLKRVLNESETRNSLNNNTQLYPYENDSIQNNNNEFKVELTDLRRQVIFLQGQLEDKEKTVNTLQKQVDSLANQNTQVIENTPLLPLDVQDRCNAATQTDRIRPISSGSLTLSGSSMEDSGSLVRVFPGEQSSAVAVPSAAPSRTSVFPA